MKGLLLHVIGLRQVNVRDVLLGRFAVVAGARVGDSK